MFKESCIYFKTCNLKYIIVDRNLFVSVVFLVLITVFLVPYNLQ